MQYDTKDKAMFEMFFAKWPEFELPKMWYISDCPSPVLVALSGNQVSIVNSPDLHGAAKELVNSIENGQKQQTFAINKNSRDTSNPV